MKVLGILVAVFLVGGIASAAQVDDNTPLGKQDSRGAYQEVSFKSFTLTLDYFDSLNQMYLKEQAQTQMKDDLFPESKKNGFDPKNGYWGQWVEIYFQNGELKSVNDQSKQYKPLDKRKPFCYVKAVVSFDSKKQLISGNYKVDGTVTLVTGTSHYGPITIGRGPGSDFHQGTLLGYKNSGAYNYDPGTPFNDFGNGKNDRGRIEQVGCDSFDPADEISAGLLKKTTGSFVEIIYP